MNDVLDRFRAASASADWILHRPPSTPAAMLRELADFAEANDLAWDRYGERGAVAQLTSGLARVFIFRDDPLERAAAYRKAERRARTDGRGSWAGCWR